LRFLLRDWRLRCAFLQDTSLDELQSGLSRLQTDAEARRDALQALVRDNFERFISCKGTIDHVLAVLRRGEGGPPAGEGRRAAAAAAAAAESAQTVVS
jgi:hypothetical protein